MIAVSHVRAVSMLRWHSWIVHVLIARKWTCRHCGHDSFREVPSVVTQPGSSSQHRAGRLTLWETLGLQWELFHQASLPLLQCAVCRWTAGWWRESSEGNQCVIRLSRWGPVVDSCIGVWAFVPWRGRWSWASPFWGGQIATINLKDTYFNVSILPRLGCPSLLVSLPKSRRLPLLC